MLAFKCYGAKQILENGGSELLKEKYAEYNLGDTYPGYDVVISLDPETKPTKIKTPGGASDEEKSKIKEDNALVKVKLAEFADEIAEKWCRFKSDFMGAPIRKALLDIKEENKENYLIEIPYRRNEKYWIKKMDDNALIYFSINFTDATDIALAKIMCNELKDSKKISSQAVSVNYYPKIDGSSDIMAELKVDPKKSSCGVISFSLASVHVKKNFETATYFLTTFRQYIEYHVRMVKCLLHSRMRKRINKFEIVFEKALRQGVHKEVAYKTTQGGTQKTDTIKEEKISGVSTKKVDLEEFTIGD
jgi:actin related protein 2/3 complex subunit 2